MSPPNNLANLVTGMRLVQRSWADYTLAHRVKVLRQAAKSYTAHAEELARASRARRRGARLHGVTS